MLAGNGWLFEQLNERVVHIFNFWFELFSHLLEAFRLATWLRVNRRFINQCVHWYIGHLLPLVEELVLRLRGHMTNFNGFGLILCEERFNFLFVALLNAQQHPLL